MVSPNELNKYLSTIVIAPMASCVKQYPTRVPENHNERK
ncbi:hypothetical protein [Flavobacterium sp. PL12]